MVRIGDRNVDSYDGCVRNLDDDSGDCDESDRCILLLILMMVLAVVEMMVSVIMEVMIIITATLTLSIPEIIRKRMLVGSLYLRG